MSTAPAGTLPDPPPAQPGQPPGPWALLAATAVGGVIGTRLGRAPLVLAAGAAALALLQQQKKHGAQSPAPSPQRPTDPMPPEDVEEQPSAAACAGWHAAPTLKLHAEPEPEQRPPAQESTRSQVEAWLSRQMQREMEESVIELGLHAPDAVAAPVASTIAVAPSRPAGEVFFSFAPPVPNAETVSAPAHTAAASDEDDYRPPPFLLDEEEDSPPAQAETVRSQKRDAFAQLTAPRDMCVVLEPAPLHEPPAEVEAGPDMTQMRPPKAEPPLPFRGPPGVPPTFAFEATTVPAPCMAPAAARPLNLEPMPSLTEPPLLALPAGALFFSVPPPIPQVEHEPEPAAPGMNAHVFEGAALPDAIEVPMGFGRDEIPAVLFKEKTHAAEDASTGTLPEAPAQEPPGMLPHPAAAMSFFNMAEPVWQIEVQLAAQGEASFDPPLAADPWQAQMEATAGAASAPELDAVTGLLTTPHASPGTMPASPFWNAAAMGACAPPEAPPPAHVLPAGPVVDAEIMIKPRTQDATRPVFVAKPRPLAPSFAAVAQQSQAKTNAHLHAQVHEHAHAQTQVSTQDLPAPLEQPPQAEAPDHLQPTRSHTRRSSWHSWWQGD